MKNENVWKLRFGGQFGFSEVTEGNGTFESDKALSLWFITTVTCSVHSELTEGNRGSE